MCIADLSFNLTSDPMLGNYTINVENGLALKTFEVKEIVFPRFEVTIEEPSSINTLDPTIPLKVCAKYTYGKGVQGTMVVKLCRKPNFYSDQRMICTLWEEKTNDNGCYQTTFNFGDASYDYYDLEIHVEMREEGTGIRFSESKTISASYAPGSLAFEAANSFYKIGYPYYITLVALFRDGTPIQNAKATLEVKFSEKVINVFGNTDKSGRVRFSLDTSNWSNQVTIQGYIEAVSSHAKPFRGVFRGAVKNVDPFYNEALSYLRLEPISRTIPCGDQVIVLVEYNINPNDLKDDTKSISFYYFVIGKSGIMLHGQKSIDKLLPKASTRGSLTFPIMFTSKFGPAPKMLGFLLLKNGLVTADRLLFNVQNCLPNKASLKFSQSEASPKTELSLAVTSSPGSMCAIRAVDKSVQINNEDKELTEEKVFGMFDSTIRGGYPKNVDEGTFIRCRAPWGWLQPLPAFLSRFLWRPWQEDVVDVFTLFKETGTKILTNAKIMRPRIPMDPCNFPMVYNSLAREQSPASELSTDVVRKFFPDTWLWDLVPIGKLGQASIQVTVPDTITQYNASAFCMGSNGFGISPQVSLTVFQPFFVDLALPYSIIQEETLVLKANVFNYLDRCMMVQATLLEPTEFTVKECQDCITSGCVCGNQAITFSWNIATNQIGLVPLTVRAEAVASSVSCQGSKPYVPPNGNVDIIQRQLLVKPKGIKREFTENMYLCLQDSANVIQRKFSLSLPKTWVVKSESAYLSVIGDILGTALQNLDKLIRMPSGCGEQNMVIMAPIIYVLGYLKATQQLSAQQKQRAIGFLQSGYQGELVYKRKDGSYSAFGNKDEDGSTWLTAFVLKCFQQAAKDIFIDKAVLQQAMDWLYLQQKTDGCFESRGKLFHTAMKGGVDDDLSLSAYITAALLEGGTSKSDHRLDQALSCLKNQAKQPSNLYTMALLAYTFALANDDFNKQKFLEKLFLSAQSSGGDIYWSPSLVSSKGSSSASIELTAYVLLALSTAPTANDLQKASKIVSWLTKQQNSDGGFSSTQDTVVAIQALAKYTSKTFNPNGNVIVTVSKGKDTLNQLKVNEKNRLLLQKMPLPDIPGEYDLHIEGTGCVFIQSVLKYNEALLPRPDTFSITAKIVNCGENAAVFYLNIVVSYIGTRPVTNMVLIEVEMLSGFKPVYEVSKLMKDFDPAKRVNIQKAVVTVYLDELDHKQRNFYMAIWQETKVKDLKPANIKIYDYYLTEENSVTTYSACK
ncbi:alpha-2-macroglobulin-like protein 1 [Engystomops pustulosus]|uniref:alpha-2-macroglobulin-like protein 1 n=1 Tax=Engystomops pustulosus TaxID=76066 RepID=UPI003AFA95E1